jgi:hypothetical protein
MDYDERSKTSFEVYYQKIRNYIAFFENLIFMLFVSFKINLL